MTDHGPGPAAASEEALRRALHDVVADLPPAPGLVDGMHRRAARIRRRRAAAGSAALAAGFVTLGILVATPYWDGAAPPGPAVRPIAPTTPPRPDPEPTIGPPTATSAVDEPTGGPSADDRTTSQTPDAQPRARFDDRFDADALDPERWVAYTGPSQPVGRWDPGALAVGDGTLRVTVTAGSGAADVRNGGLKSVAAQRDGRWQVRWRLTPGRGVIAQFVLFGDGPEGVRYAATLDPDAGTLTLRDTTRDDDRSVGVDAAEFHTVALERSPSGVRWSLDGTVVAEHPADKRPPALLLGLQAFVGDPRCAEPAVCTGPDTAVLEVDRVSVRPLPRN